MNSVRATLLRAAWGALLTMIGTLTIRADDILLPLTNSWRYNQTMVWDGTNWMAQGFDDSTLPAGRGVLAQESNNSFVTSRSNTVLTLGRITYYFRTHFNYTGAIPGVVLTFSNIVDDGAVFYLNGREITRRFIASGTTVAYATLASDHEATAYDVFRLSGPVIETNLVQGDNVLAVEVHQTTTGSSDIVFGLALSAAQSQLTQPPLRMPLDPPTYGYSIVNAFPGLSFGSPVSIKSAPGETNRVFVVDKGGRIYVITNLASPNLTTFLDLSGRVLNSGESGLLGLAFHPGYATNGYFFVFYSVTATTAQGNNSLHQRLSRFQTSSTNANFASTNSEQQLITQADPASNHNGGDLHFGQDGLLYISLGDGGVQYDGSANSQRIDRNFFSAILRLDVDLPARPGSLMPNPHPANTNTGSINYRIPADNPFIGRTNFDGVTVNPASVRTEIYALGFRNPWRFSFDSGTGMLYCGDVGQDTWEEVDVITRGGNYGWAYFEATHTGYKSGTPRETLTPPIQEYRHGSAADQGNAVIGGVVYRGARFPQLYGWYVFGDNTSANVWIMRYDRTNTVPFQRIGGRSGVSSFGIDPSNGDVLLTDVSGGGVYRLIYDTNSPSGTPIPPTLADTGAFGNLAGLTNSTQALSANPGLKPYEINVPFWSDGARKSRWFTAVTNSVGFQAEGNWSFAPGLAWVKHFDLEMTNGVPESARRLETRVLVKNSNSVYGVTYRWGNSLTNALLVPDQGMDEQFTITEDGATRTQVWHYPSRSECLICHTPVGGYVLGFNTPQLNRDLGTNDNQIAALQDARIFTGQISNLNALRALAPATNGSASVEWRVRSYLAANCAQCHQPGGAGGGFWNAAISNSTAAAGLINGALNNNYGNTNARVIAPGSLEDSMLLTRISRRGPGQMPPLASTVLDTQAIQLVTMWITNDLASGWTNGTSPLRLGVSTVKGAATLEFMQPANRAAWVETTAELGPEAAWQFLDEPANRPTYPVTNSPVTISEAHTNTAQRFFRVRVGTP